jgi:uroporphyrin-3 C-methyltransferase
MNRVTDDSNATLSPPVAPPQPAVLPPQPTPAIAPAHAGALTSRLWIVGVVVFGALAVGGFVFAWQTQERVRALEQELVRRQQASQEDATEARVLAKQALDSVREANGKLGVLDERVAESALQRSQVEDLIQSLSRSRDENVLADAEAALRVAMQQAALTGTTEPIATVLRQTDERLARYGNPRLERVRRAVARDLDRVRTTAVVDVPSLTIRLDEAIRQIDDLPLLSTPERATTMARSASAAAASGSAVAAAASGAGARATPAVARAASASASASARSDYSEADQPPWLAKLHRAWTSFSTPFFGELRQAIRVTSIEHPEAMLLTPEQSFFLRENVKLRLLNARLSLLSRQYDLAQADLQQAQGALDRYFDRSSRRVVAVADSLRQISAQARQVTFPRPDDTLAALAAVAGH